MPSKSLEERNECYWVPDSDMFSIPCRLVNRGSVELTMKDCLTDEEQKVTVQRCGARIPDSFVQHFRSGYDDIEHSDDVSEQAVLFTLRVRHSIRSVYTNIGTIVVAVNPYAVYDHLYSKETYETIRKQENTPETPHIWSLAQRAFYSLKETGRDQAIVISGESGAGKTETTKLCLQHLSMLASNKSFEEAKTTANIRRSSNSNISALRRASLADAKGSIDSRVLATNPLFESFGNAKTSRNNNSSRFGKWLQITFSPQFNLTGATITHYLLEKNRVVTQGKDERNFHIFYQLISSSDTLGSPEQFNYLNQSGCTDIEGVDDLDDFQCTDTAFRNLGFSPLVVAAVYRLLEAILFLGNVNFVSDGDGARVEPGSTSEHDLELVCGILEIERSELVSLLTHRKLVIRGTTTLRQLNPEAAVAERDSICKNLYETIFTYIVQEANKNLHMTSSGSSGETKDARVVGLLDIFGFELLQLNSLEQLLINYCNEILQKHFLDFVLVKEAMAYMEEGIRVERVDFEDNGPVINLLSQRPGGILSQLDEEVMLPQGASDKFMSKVEKRHALRTPGCRFKKTVKMKPAEFCILHFAGEVKYSANDFVEKNRDRVDREVFSAMGMEQLKTILDAIAPPAGETSQSDGSSSSTSRDAPNSPARRGTSAGSAQNKKSTLCNRFVTQLGCLANILRDSENHFVRCIKPNTIKSAMAFDCMLVLEQLRYSGVLEATRIRKLGYPVRRPLEEFRGNYWVLSKLARAAVFNHSALAGCRAILDNVANNPDFAGFMKGVQVGKTKVFMKTDSLYLLERARSALILRAAVLWQTLYRMVCGKRLLVRRRAALVRVRKAVIHCQSGLSEENIHPRMHEMAESLHDCEDCDMDLPETRAAMVTLDETCEIDMALVDINHLLDTADPDDEDVGETFGKFKKYMALFERKGVALPREDELLDMYEKMEIKGEALVELKNAVDSFDERRIAKCCARIRDLQNRHGQFGNEELVDAERRLALLKLEVAHISSLIEEVTVIVDVIAPSDLGLVAFTPTLVNLENTLNKMLSTYEQKHPQSSKTLKTVASGCLLVLKLLRVCHEGNGDANMALLSTGLDGNLEDCVTLAQEVAPSYAAFLNMFLEVADKMIDIACECADIKVHIPLAVDKVNSAPEATDFEDDELCQLLRQFESADCFGAGLEAMMPHLFFLVHIRVLVASQSWEKILLVLKAQEEVDVWLEVHEEVAGYDFSPRGPSAGLRCSSDVTEARRVRHSTTAIPAPSAAALKVASHRVDPTLDEFYRLVLAKTGMYRVQAVQYYCQILLLDACRARVVRGAPGGVFIPAGSCLHLEGALGEASALGIFKSVREGGPTTSADKATALAVGMCTMLRHFRHFLLQKSVRPEDMVPCEDDKLFEAWRADLNANKCAYLKSIPDFDPTSILQEIELLRSERFNRYCCAQLEAAVRNFPLESEGSEFGKIELMTGNTAALQRAVDLVLSEDLSRGARLNTLLQLGEHLLIARRTFPLPECISMSADEFSEAVTAAEKVVSDIAGMINTPSSTGETVEGCIEGISMTNEVSVMLDHLSNARCLVDIRRLLSHGHVEGGYFEHLDLVAMDMDRDGVPRVTIAPSAVDCVPYEACISDMEAVVGQASDMLMQPSVEVLNLLETARLVVRLRKHVGNYNWSKASQVLEDMQSHESLSTYIQALRKEIGPLVDPVRHLTLFDTLEKVLAEGSCASAGPRGMCDVRQVEWTPLDEAIEQYSLFEEDWRESGEPLSMAAPAFVSQLHREVKSVRTLRYCIVTTDFEALKDELASARLNNVGTGCVAAAIPDFSRARQECDDNQICKALVSGMRNASLGGSYDHYDLNAADAPTLDELDEALEEALPVIEDYGEESESVLSALVQVTQLFRVHVLLLKEALHLDELESLHRDMLAACADLERRVADRAASLQDFCIDHGLSDAGIFVYVNVVHGVRQLVSDEQAWALRYNTSRSMLAATVSALATGFEDIFIVDETRIPDELPVQALQEAVAWRRRLANATPHYVFPEETELLLSTSESVLKQRMAVRENRLTDAALEQGNLMTTVPPEVWPEACEKEIRLMNDAIRAWELRNDAVAAAAEGAFHLVPGAIDARVPSVRTGPLEDCREECRASLTALGSPSARKVLNEVIDLLSDVITLRTTYMAGLDCSEYVDSDWSRIKELADDLQQDLDEAHKTMRVALSEEAFALELAAADRLYYAHVSSALSAEYIRGRPGAIDTQGADMAVKKLDRALNSRLNEEASTYASTEHLRRIATDILALRRKFYECVSAGELEGDATSAQIDASMDRWRAVGRHIKETLSSASFDADNLEWRLVWREVCLMADEATYRRHHCKLAHSLEIVRNCYARKDRDFEERDYVKRANMLTGNADFSQSLKDLDTILTDGTTPYLSMVDMKDSDAFMEAVYALIQCTHVVREIRGLVVTGEWEAIQHLRARVDGAMDFDRFPWAATELELALSQVVNARCFLLIDSNVSTWVNERSSSSEEALISALEAVEASEPSDQLLKGVPEVVRQVLFLVSMCADATPDHLRSAVDFPAHTIQELQITIGQFQSTYKYMNKELLHAVHKSSHIAEQLIVMGAIRHALSRGKAGGTVGDMDYTTIETSELDGVLKSSRRLAVVAEELQGLLSIGQHILHLRLMQASQRWGSVSAILEKASSVEDRAAQAFVHDETSRANEDILHRYTVKLMRDELDRFEQAEVELSERRQAIEDAEGKEEEEGGFLFDHGRSLLVCHADYFYGDVEDGDDDGDPVIIEDHRALPPAPPRRIPEAPQLHSSPQCVRRIDITFDGIELRALESAHREAVQVGLQTASSRRLSRTCEFILRLRYYLRECDWTAVRAMLREAHREGEHALDPQAKREIAAVHWHLAQRTALLDVREAMTRDRAYATSRGFTIGSVATDELQQAVKRLAHEIDDIEIMARQSQDDFRSRQGSRGAHSHKPISESSRLRLMKEWLKGAKSILQVRCQLIAGDFRGCYRLIDRLLRTRLLRYNDELHTYRRMLRRSMEVDENFDSAHAAVERGSINDLAKILNHDHEKSVKDLGYMAFGIERVRIAYERLCTLETSLFVACRDRDYDAIAQMLQILGDKALNPALVRKARVVYADYEFAADHLRAVVEAHAGGTITAPSAREQLLAIADKVPYLFRDKHVQEARVLVRLSPTATSAASVAMAVNGACAYAAASITIQHREPFYADRRSWDRYQLIQFGGFRRAQAYHGWSRDPQYEVKLDMYIDEMLSHHEGLLHHSLTDLPPKLDAVAIATFSRLVLPLEQGLLGEDSAALATLLRLGRRCPSMRDEIIGQHIRLIRHNPHADRRRAMWRSLAACLRHFPSSREFEPFLELFFLQDGANDPNCPTPDRCLRLLHEAVFRYGYGTPLDGAYDDSHEVMTQWLTCELMPEHYPREDPALHGYKQGGGYDAVSGGQEPIVHYASVD